MRSTCAMYFAEIFLHISTCLLQYKEECYDQEEKKLKNAIYHTSQPFITGKWGCGLYNSDPILKYMMLSIVCSLNKTKGKFLIFGDTELYNELKKIYDYYSTHNTRILHLSYFVANHLKDCGMKTEFFIPQ